jgi:hypothetical protein
MSDEQPQNASEGIVGQSVSTAGLAGDLVTLTITNLTDTQARRIIDGVWGSIIWCQRKAYPSNDIECTISCQPANAVGQQEAACGRSAGPEC